MLILLTNDDGIHAPGLLALERRLRTFGDVVVVAPTTERSGVGHSITHLTPLIVKEAFLGDGAADGQPRWGWAVEGSPADCVKMGILQFCPRPPDMVLSGINSGLNAGINVLYSGTVAAAIEGAFFGITSIAVSLERDPDARFDRAARLACEIIRQILEKKGFEPQLYSMNIPTAALTGAPEVCCAPMSQARYSDSFEKRHDPWGRAYYWLKGGPPQAATDEETDLSALAQGKVTITPLHYDMTSRAALAEMRRWRFPLAGIPESDVESEPARRLPAVRVRRRREIETA
jgi:5'-nucleotidase